MRPRHITPEEFAIMQQRVQGEVTRTRPRIATTTSSGPPTVGPNPAPAPLMLALTGQLPSGKNAVQHTRTGQHYPKPQFKAWRQRSTIELIGQHETPCISKPVRLTVEYWPGDERTRDVSGQLDALFHLLVYAKVLKDDGLVWDVTWKRQGLNRKFPKVVMTVEAV